MFYLQAPYPTLQTVTVLPDPKFSDAMNLTDAVTVKRAMDGTRYTYVKTKGGRRKLKWVFQLTAQQGPGTQSVYTVLLCLKNLRDRPPGAGLDRPLHGQSLRVRYPRTGGTGPSRLAPWRDSGHQHHV